MTAWNLVRECARLGVRLEAEGGRLLYSAPAPIPRPLEAAMRANKPALIAYLAAPARPGELLPRSLAHLEPKRLYHFPTPSGLATVKREREGWSWCYPREPGGYWKGDRADFEVWLKAQASGSGPRICLARVQTRPPRADRRPA